MSGEVTGGSDRPGVGALGTAEERAYEARAAESALWTAGRLMMGVFGFGFAALAFAYFYLRSSNSEGLWRPHGMTAPTGTGAAIMALTVAAAAMVAFGLRRLRRGLLIDWQVAWWAAVTGGLLAVGLQIWELTDLPFHPGASGYASCFVGWAGMNIVLLLTGVYWAETQLARHARLARDPTSGGGEGGVSRLTRVNLEACANHWMFIAVVAIFFWVFLYVSG